MNVTFSINEYDFEGDIVEKGIYLHFGHTKIKVANTIEEYAAFVNDLEEMKGEIYENEYFLRN